MGRKNKYTKEIKLKAILDYKKGIKSIIQLCDELDCSYMSIRAWIRGIELKEMTFLIIKQIDHTQRLQAKLKGLTSMKYRNQALVA